MEKFFTEVFFIWIVIPGKGFLKQEGKRTTLMFALWENVKERPGIDKVDLKI